MPKKEEARLDKLRPDCIGWVKVRLARLRPDQPDLGGGGVRTYRRMDVWTYGCMDGRMDVWTDVYT
jgi:hypothetical protein